jgi:hypothetical protein
MNMTHSIWFWWALGLPFCLLLIRRMNRKTRRPLDVAWYVLGIVMLIEAVLWPMMIALAGLILLMHFLGASPDMPTDGSEPDTQEPERLRFDRPVFRAGINVTVRRGTKWADLAKKGPVEFLDNQTNRVIGKSTLQAVVMKFADLHDSDLVNEHDPACRNYYGLLNAMRDVYPDFSERELVTIVSFFLPANDPRITRQPVQPLDSVKQP